MPSLFEVLKEKFSERIREANSYSPNSMVEDNRNKDDWDTRDKYLKSLRREVRRIQDKKEKEDLQKIIFNERRQHDVGWIGSSSMLKSNQNTGSEYKMKKKAKRTTKKRK